jgi:hypothetical protein
LARREVNFSVVSTLTKCKEALHGKTMGTVVRHRPGCIDVVSYLLELVQIICYNLLPGGQH